jgi:hypothetical protein
MPTWEAPNSKRNEKSFRNMKKLSRRGKKNLRYVNESSRNGTRSLTRLSIARKSSVMDGALYVLLWSSILFRDNVFVMDYDEDINTSATIIPSIEILGPITQSWAQ